MKRGVKKSTRKSSKLRKSSTLHKKKSKQVKQKTIKPHSKRKHISRKPEPQVFLSPYMLILTGIILIFVMLTLFQKVTPETNQVQQLVIDVAIQPDDARSSQVTKTLIELSQRFKNQLELKFHLKTNGDEDARRLECMKELDRAKFPYYIYCMSSGESDCSSFISNPTVINKCIQNQGSRLVQNDLDWISSQGLDVVPVIIIDGKRFNGDRNEIGFSKEFCRLLKNPPLICSVLPQCFTADDCSPKEGKIAKCITSNNRLSCAYFEDKGVTVKIVTSPNCVECSTDKVLNVLRNEFSSVHVVTIESTSKMGKLLIEEEQLTDFPAFLFTKDIETNIQFPRIQNSLELRINYYVLQKSAQTSQIS